MTAAPRTVAAVQPDHKAGDEFIRQQDTCTPWGLHYLAYQDRYHELPARRSSRKPRKLITF